MTDQPTRGPKSQPLRDPRKGVHRVTDLGSIDLEAELNDLLNDLDNLELPRSSASETGTSPSETGTSASEARAQPAAAPRPERQSRPAQVQGDPRNATLRGGGAEVSDSAFLTELGFGQSDELALDLALEADPPAGEVAAQRAELEQVKAKYKRAVSDFENHRRRARREKETLVEQANERLLKDLLPVLDNFELALGHRDHDELSLAQYASGVEMCHQLMLQTLSRFGLRPFESVGQLFDPHVHQALAQRPSDTVPPGHVSGQAQRGYHLHDKLLRPALVTVAAAQSLEVLAPVETSEELLETEPIPAGDERVGVATLAKPNNTKNETHIGSVPDGAEEELAQGDDILGANGAAEAGSETQELEEGDSGQVSAGQTAPGEPPPLPSEPAAIEAVESGGASHS